MAHPLVDQLRFTRSEWLRGLNGLSDQDGARHVGRMNCISWVVGHLAWNEHRYWLQRAQGIMLIPGINGQYGYGAPMSTPALSEMSDLWHQVTRATDPFLDTLTTEALQIDLLIDGKSVNQSLGTAMLALIYHYWYHLGEIQAIRQLLNHGDLPEYVGDIEAEAPYRPE